MPIGKWLREPMALAPGFCPDCYAPMGVCWSAEAASSFQRTIARETFELWCPGCQSAEGFYRADRRLVAFIGEVRPAVSEVDQPAPVTVWVRPGCALEPRRLASVLADFDRLAQARDIHARNPGQWGLEPREDGQLWAPWCPSDLPEGPRYGQPLPYVEGQVGASRMHPDRACLICDTPLVVGDSCWRPKRPESGLARVGWSQWAATTALVCVPCAEQAKARGVPKPDPELEDRGLRLVTADDVLDHA